jgi:hypothetical protein
MPENMPQRARKAPRTPRDIAKQMTTRLENRLLRFVMADAYAIPEPLEDGKKAPKSHLMTGEQVTAVFVLLKKYKPDLKSVELKGDPDQPLVYEVRRTFVHADRPANAGDMPATGESEPL